MFCIFGPFPVKIRSQTVAGKRIASVSRWLIHGSKRLKSTTCSLWSADDSSALTWRADAPSASKELKADESSALQGSLPAAASSASFLARIISTQAFK